MTWPRTAHTGTTFPQGRHKGFARFLLLFTTTTHSCPVTSGGPAGATPAVLPPGSPPPHRDHRGSQQPRAGASLGIGTVWRRRP